MRFCFFGGNQQSKWHEASSSFSSTNQSASSCLAIEQIAPLIQINSGNGILLPSTALGWRQLGRHPKCAVTLGRPNLANEVLGQGAKGAHQLRGYGAPLGAPTLTAFPLRAPNVQGKAEDTSTSPAALGRRTRKPALVCYFFAFSIFVTVN